MKFTKKKLVLIRFALKLYKAELERNALAMENAKDFNLEVHGYIEKDRAAVGDMILSISVQLRETADKLIRKGV